MSCPFASSPGNKRRHAIVVPGLARVARVQFRDLRARFEQRHYVLQAEDRARLGPERVIDSGEELVVLEVVDRPPMGGRVVEPGLPGNVMDPKAVAPLPDE